MRAGALLTAVAAFGLLGGLPVASVSAHGQTSGGASVGAGCNALLHGPHKDTQKEIESATVNSDHSVTMEVTVSWRSQVNAKQGEHVFDCVWDGQPSNKGTVVGGTGHPGSDCSSQGLPCTFSVTTEPLQPGDHELCDIAKIEGTWAKPDQNGPAPSGSRTPTVCKKVEIPGPSPSPLPSPGSSPSPAPGSTPMPSPSVSPSGGGAGAGGAVPGLPNTGAR
jgi:hypothetical protein